MPLEGTWPQQACLSSSSSLASEKEAWPQGNHLASPGAQHAADPTSALTSLTLLLMWHWLSHSDSLLSSSLFLGVAFQPPPPKINCPLQSVPSRACPPLVCSTVAHQLFAHLATDSAQLSSATLAQPPSYSAYSRFNSSRIRSSERTVGTV